jgi:hypothetical protein
MFDSGTQIQNLRARASTSLSEQIHAALIGFGEILNGTLGLPSPSRLRSKIGANPWLSNGKLGEGRRVRAAGSM